MTISTRRLALRVLAGILATAFLGATEPALAAKPPVYSADDKIAVKGADVVAYFTQRRAVYGKAKFSHRWKDRVWHFSSAGNLAKFKANPVKYAPQFGGYCAYAVSRGYTAKIEPEAWSIVDGKLYLNYDRAIRGLWALQKSSNIRRGHANWPAVLER